MKMKAYIVGLKVSRHFVEDDRSDFGYEPITKCTFMLLSNYSEKFEAVLWEDYTERIDGLKGSLGRGTLHKVGEFGEKTHEVTDKCIDVNLEYESVDGEWKITKFRTPGILGEQAVSFIEGDGGSVYEPKGGLFVNMKYFRALGEPERKVSWITGTDAMTIVNLMGGVRDLKVEYITGREPLGFITADILAIGEDCKYGYDEIDNAIYGAHTNIMFNGKDTRKTWK